MTMSRLIRLFRRGPGLRPTEACIICGEPFGDMVHEITHEGSRHLYCHPVDRCSVCNEVMPADMTREGNHHLYCHNYWVAQLGAPTAAAPAQHTPGPWAVHSPTEGNPTTGDSQTHTRRRGGSYEYQIGTFRIDRR
jgi:hypothetical protein